MGRSAWLRVPAKLLLSLVHEQPKTQQAMSQVQGATREHRQEQNGARDELWCGAKVLPGERGKDRAGGKLRTSELSLHG